MQEAPPQAQTDRKVLLVHAAVYLAVNAVLAFINLSQEATEGQALVIWFIWPLAGWGIGLAAHALALALKQNAERNDGPPSLLQDADVRGVAMHLFAYLAVNALLIVVNVTQTPQSFWAIWPLAGWGIGLGAHAFLVYRAVLRRTAEHYAREQLILREMQVERLAAAIASTVSEEEREAQEEIEAQEEAADQAAAAESAASPAKKKQTRKKQAATRKKAAPRQRSAAKGRKPKAAARKTTTGKAAAKKKTAAKAPAKKPASRRKRSGTKPAVQSVG